MENESAGQVRMDKRVDMVDVIAGFNVDCHHHYHMRDDPLERGLCECYVLTKGIWKERNETNKHNAAYDTHFVFTTFIGIDLSGRLGMVFVSTQANYIRHPQEAPKGCRVDCEAHC